MLDRRPTFRRAPRRMTWLTAVGFGVMVGVAGAGCARHADAPADPQADYAYSIAPPAEGSWLLPVEATLDRAPSRRTAQSHRAPYGGRCGDVTRLSARRQRARRPAAPSPRDTATAGGHRRARPTASFATSWTWTRWPLAVIGWTAGLRRVR